MASYVGLAEWVMRNLAAYAEEVLDERLLLFSLVLDAGRVLGSLLPKLWPRIWEECLSRTGLVFSGCMDEDEEACEELSEAWGCVAERLRPLVEEVTPWKSMEELHEKIKEVMDHG